MRVLATATLVLFLTATTAIAEAQMRESPSVTVAQLMQKRVGVYQALTRKPTPAEKLSVAGLSWTCRGTRCQAAGPPPESLVKACQTFAKQVGPIDAFGFAKRMLNEVELAECNEAPVTGAPRAPVAAPAPTQQTQPQAAPPPTQQTQPRTVPAPTQQARPSPPAPAPQQVQPERPVAGPGSALPGAVTADFDYVHQSVAEACRRPMGVQFVDRYTGNPADLVWEFGDGSRAVGERNPIHYYSTEGIYTVCLTAIGEGARAGAPLRSRFCRRIYVDPIVQILNSFLGRLEEKIESASQPFSGQLDAVLSRPPFNRIQAGDKQAARQLAGQTEAKSVEIAAFLMRRIYLDYQPLIYVYAGAGADACDALGYNPCQVGWNAVGYLYVDLQDVGALLFRAAGCEQGSPFGSNEDQTGRDSYVTITANVGTSIGVGADIAYGFLFVPRGSRPPDADVPLNEIDLGPGCEFDLDLNDLWNFATVTLTGFGFYRGTDGSFGIEPTAVSLEATTQIVQVDLSASHAMTTALKAMQCGLDIYRRTGGLHGSKVDYARVLSEAFEADPFADPPRFRIDCGNVQCMGVNCVGEVSPLGAFRDVRWGPPFVLLRKLMCLAPVEVEKLRIDGKGSLNVGGSLGPRVDFALEASPGTGAELEIGTPLLLVEVDSLSKSASGHGQVTGTVWLGGFSLGVMTVGVEDPQGSGLPRWTASGKLVNILDFEYTLDTSGREHLTVGAGSFSLDVKNFVSLNDDSASFSGDLYWNDMNLGNGEVTVRRGGGVQGTLLGYIGFDYQYPMPSFALTAGSLSMRVEQATRLDAATVRYSGQLSWAGNQLGRLDLDAGPSGAATGLETGLSFPLSTPDQGVTLSYTVTLDGNVRVEARTDGTVTGSFSGTATTTSHIHITGDDLGIAAFDFERTFKESRDTPSASVSSDGKVTVSYYYPGLDWMVQEVPVPCGIEYCGDRIKVPCGIKTCPEDVGVPTGVHKKTGSRAFDLW
jgi:hypothetical protein